MASTALRLLGGGDTGLPVSPDRVLYFLTLVANSFPTNSMATGFRIDGTYSARRVYASRLGVDVRTITRYTAELVSADAIKYVPTHKRPNLYVVGEVQKGGKRVLLLKATDGVWIVYLPIGDLELMCELAKSKALDRRISNSWVAIVYWCCLALSRSFSAEHRGEASPLTEGEVRSCSEMIRDGYECGEFGASEIADQLPIDRKDVKRALGLLERLGWIKLHGDVVSVGFDGYRYLDESSRGLFSSTECSTVGGSEIPISGGLGGSEIPIFDPIWGSQIHQIQDLREANRRSPGPRGGIEGMIDPNDRPSAAPPSAEVVRLPTTETKGRFWTEVEVGTKRKVHKVKRGDRWLSPAEAEVRDSALSKLDAVQAGDPHGGDLTIEEHVEVWRHRFFNRFDCEEQSLTSIDKRAGAAKNLQKFLLDQCCGSNFVLYEYLKWTIRWWVKKQAENEESGRTKAYPTGKPTLIHVLKSDSLWNEFWTHWLKRCENDSIYPDGNDALNDAPDGQKDLADPKRFYQWLRAGTIEEPPSRR